VAHELLTVYGPGGTVESVEALVDTGATQTTVTESFAARVGLPRRGPAPVETNDGIRIFQWSDGWVAMRGLAPVHVPLWIAPDDVEPAIGETTLSELGAVLVFPAPQYEGVPPAPTGGPPYIAPNAYEAAGRSKMAQGWTGRVSANLTVCASCPERRPGLIDRCGACGCPTATRALTSCPLGKF